MPTPESIERGIAREITRHVTNLDRYLAETELRARNARAAIADGARVGHLFGVLGDSPTKAEQAYAAVEALLNVGAVVLTPEELAAAYRVERIGG